MWEAAAAAYVSQPEWYFLWVYQILKFSFFGGAAEVAALVGVTVGGLVMFLLPFLDRNQERDPSKRPFYTTIGFILIAELIVLAVWGYYTPGQVIPDSQAVTIVGGVALVITFMSLLTYKMMNGRIMIPRSISGGGMKVTRFIGTPFEYPRLTLVFTMLLATSSAALSSAASLLSSPASDPGLLTISLTAGLVSLYFMVSLVKRLARADLLQEARQK